MNTKAIWMLDKDRRMQAFIERYLDLDEMTGNRTLAEKHEMQEIADAIMPTLINERYQCEAARARAFGEAAEIAFAIRRNRCGCPHCESTATEIASIIQGNQLAAEIKAEQASG